MRHSCRKNRVWAASLLPLALGGCAHYQFPVNQLESPEAHGSRNPGGSLPSPGRIELGILSGSDLIAPQVQGPMSLFLGFSTAITERLDVGIRLEPEAPLSLRAKYQIAGESEAKSSPGFSAALCAAPGVLIGKENSSSTLLLSGDLSVPLGYRLSNAHQVTATPFFGFASLSGVTQNASGISGSVSASRLGAGLGYQYSLESLFAQAEFAYASGSIGSSQIGGLFLAASFGLAL